MKKQKTIRHPLILKAVFRDQAMIGRLLVLLAIMLITPVDKPSLWILEDWGGLHIHSWIWGALFMLNGVILMVCRRLLFAYVGIVIAAGLLATVSIAGYMTTGLNFGSVLALGLFLQCAQTARDFTSIKKAADREGRKQKQEAGQ